MSDISTLVDYCSAFPVAIKGPDGKDTGIVFNIVSAESEQVAMVSRRLDSERWQVVFSSNDKRLTPEQVAEFTAKSERELLIAAIVSWDWGEHTWEHIDSNSPCNEENKRFVIEHKNSKWIRDQLTSKSADIANFTQPSKKTVRSTSRK